MYKQRVIALLLLSFFFTLNINALEFNDNTILNLFPSMSDGELGEIREKRIALYNSINPYYAEMCTSTQFIPNNIEGSKKGGTGGHATLFLNGACIDSSAPYPQLKMCDDSVDLTDPNSSGVGVSLNLMYSTVRFIAIPGRDNFFKGPVSWNQRITKEVVENSRAYYMKQNWFKGVRMTEEELASCNCKSLRCDEQEAKKCLIDKNMGIDFAITFARTSYCTKLPMPRAAIKKMVNYLNKRNTDAFKRSKNGMMRGYKYDVILDNCSHIIHNALAETGFFDHKKELKSTWYNKGRALLSEGVADIGLTEITGGEFGYMSIPINNFNRIVNRSIDLKLDNLARIIRNHNLRDTLVNEDYNWLPTGIGNIVSVTSIRRDNDAYSSGGVGFSLPYTKELFEQYTDVTDPDYRSYYSNLCENLKHYNNKFNKALETLDQSISLSEDNMYFWAKYREEIIKQLIIVNKNIKNNCFH